MNSSKVMVDFNAFIGKDVVTKKMNVFIKELSIVDVVTRYVAHWIFKQPNGVQNGFAVFPRSH